MTKKQTYKIYDNKFFFKTLEREKKRIVYRSLCFWSLSFFASSITKRWTTSKGTGNRYPIPAFHEELWSVASGGGDMVIICPRGFSKSTTVSRILNLWFLVFGIEASILLISSKGLGEVIIGDIRKELEENKILKYLFGELVPSIDRRENKLEKWRQSELQLLNGVEIKTLSKGQAVRGQRPTLIVADDPEENRDVKNPIIANEFFNWVFTTLYPALDEGGRMIVLGTIISNNCFIQRLKAESGQRDFRVFEYPAILNFDEKKIEKGTMNGEEYYFFRPGIGKPLWPGRMEIAELEQKYNKIRHDAFMQEYMNVPLVLNGSPVFDKKNSFKIVKPVFEKMNFKFYKNLIEKTIENGQEVEKKEKGFMGIDLANGNVNGDFTTVWIRNEAGELLATYREHIAQDILADVLDQIIPFFDDVFIVPENNMGLAFLQASKKYNWFFKIYRKKVFDQITMKESEILGFNTNLKTKSLIISDFSEYMRAGTLEVSAEEKDEIDHYYYDEKGAMNAISPWHDDTVIADALCIQAIKHGLASPSITVF